MVDYLKKLDGTGRKPRDIQIDYLKHISAQLDKTKIHVLNGPPGVGKSMIGRAIQIAHHDCAIISPSNQLVDQYCATYEELNAIKGKDRYETEQEYRKARKAGLHSPNVFNPLSYYYYYLTQTGAIKPSVVVIDEAHKLADMLLMTIAKSFPIGYYGIPKDFNDVEFFDWVTKTTTKLAPFANELSGRKARFGAMFQQLKILQEYLTNNLDKVEIFYEMKENYRTKKDEEHLTVKPLVVPYDLMNTIFGTRTRYFLFSGSITDYHIRELFPNELKMDYVAYEPLAPVENTPIIVDPIPKAQRKDPKSIADKIREIYIKEGRPNTMVHLSYALAKKVAPFLLDINPIVHNNKDKEYKLDVFKKKGGLLLASGMAEGVDLPGDLCRLIIVPCLLWPNKGDQAVQKRLALPNGQFWYVLETVMTFVQQIGRGVRGPDDACKTYVLDCMFKSTISKPAIDKRLSQKFKDSIRSV